jgi:hypothetical protein
MWCLTLLVSPEDIGWRPVCTDGMSSRTRQTIHFTHGAAMTVAMAGPCRTGFMVSA